MGSTPVGGSEISLSEYFDLRTLLCYVSTNRVVTNNICYLVKFSYLQPSSF